jgi:hypothetical protein
MFKIGFTKKDVIRSAYAFAFAAIGYIVIAQPKDVVTWRAAAIGAVAAGIAAVKNLVLADGSTAKG